MSRFRLNPALVVGAMTSGVIEPTLDTETGTMLRPVRMHGVSQTPAKPKVPGCRATFCRTKDVCECDCRKCAYECGERRVNSIRRDGEG